MTSGDHPVAAVVALAATDDDRPMNAERLQHLGSATAGVFHQHHRRNAELLNGVLVKGSCLLARDPVHFMAARVAFTMATYCSANSRIRAKLRAATAAGSTSWLPMPRQQAP